MSDDVEQMIARYEQRASELQEDLLQIAAVIDAPDFPKDKGHEIVRRLNIANEQFRDVLCFAQGTVEA